MYSVLQPAGKIVLYLISKYLYLKTRVKKNYAAKLQIFNIKSQTATREFCSQIQSQYHRQLHKNRASLLSV